MPMIDKPTIWCRDGMSELWDALSEYVDFIEQFGVLDPLDCVTGVFPTNDDIEDQGCLIMCRVTVLSPVARCIIPIGSGSWIEVEGCT
jgi:hypothetical protein